MRSHRTQWFSSFLAALLVVAGLSGTICAMAPASGRSCSMHDCCGASDSSRLGEIVLSSASCMARIEMGATAPVIRPERSDRSIASVAVIARSHDASVSVEAPGFAAVELERSGGDLLLKNHILRI